MGSYAIKSTNCVVKMSTEAHHIGALYGGKVKFCSALRSLWDFFISFSKLLNIKSTTIYFRCQSPKYENGFKHLWHLALGRAMNTNDENV